MKSAIELDAEAADLERRAIDLRRQAALQLRRAKVRPLIERVRKCAGAGAFYGPLSCQDLLDLLSMVEQMETSLKRIAAGGYLDGATMSAALALREILGDEP